MSKPKNNKKVYFVLSTIFTILSMFCFIISTFFIKEFNGLSELEDGYGAFIIGLFLVLFIAGSYGAYIITLIPALIFNILNIKRTLNLTFKSISIVYLTFIGMSLVTILIKLIF